MEVGKCSYYLLHFTPLVLFLGILVNQTSQEKFKADISLEAQE